MRQKDNQLITLQTAMWRLKAEMRIDQTALQDMKNLAWEELHVRLQLRSLQIEVEVDKEVPIDFYINKTGMDRFQDCCKV